MCGIYMMPVIQWRLPPGNDLKPYGDDGRVTDNTSTPRCEHMPVNE